MEKKDKMTNTGLLKGLPIFLLVLLILTIILIFSVLYAVTVGSANISTKDVYQVIIYELFNIGDASILSKGAIHDIVWIIRLPRIILAVGAGAGLAVVGAVMQAVVQNPLADPYILGISSGASLGATSSVLLGISFFGYNEIGIGAFIGAMVIAFSVVAISNIGGKATSVKLVLSGVALSSICSAFSNLIVYMADDPQRFRTVSFWLMGSLAGADWKNDIRILIIVSLSILFFITQYRKLNLMLMGDEVAITLGTNLHWYRSIFLIVSSLIVGFVVYSSGVIGFVGLIIPHFVRSIFGVNHKTLIPITALTGSIFLIWADIVSRTILPRTEIPIGILISVVGAPVFIILLIRKTYSFGKT